MMMDGLADEAAAMFVEVFMWFVGKELHFF